MHGKAENRREVSTVSNNSGRRSVFVEFSVLKWSVQPRVRERRIQELGRGSWGLRDEVSFPEAGDLQIMSQ